MSFVCRARGGPGSASERSCGGYFGPALQFERRGQLDGHTRSETLAPSSIKTCASLDITIYTAARAVRRRYYGATPSRRCVHQPLWRASCRAKLVFFAGICFSSLHLFAASLPTT